MIMAEAAECVSIVENAESGSPVGIMIPWNRIVDHFNSSRRVF